MDGDCLRSWSGFICIEHVELVTLSPVWLARNAPKCTRTGGPGPSPFGDPGRQSRVATIPVIIPNQDEGAPGSSSAAAEEPGLKYDEVQVTRK
jgi:hypothetical protein